LKIKLGTNEDWSLIADIWLRVSLSAHHFIDASYWMSRRTELEVKYLPLAQTYVCVDEGEIIGFVSMVDDYLAALFIEEAYQGKGYGAQLVEYVKRNRKSIMLKVFMKNTSAFQFYLKQGFIVEQELVDQETNEGEYVMVWSQTE
jgi:putative acetyltransferase